MTENDVFPDRIRQEVVSQLETIEERLYEFNRKKDGSLHDEIHAVLKATDDVRSELAELPNLKPLKVDHIEDLEKEVEELRQEINVLLNSTSDTETMDELKEDLQGFTKIEEELDEVRRANKN